MTQSGNQKMLPAGRWKLIYDAMGYGQIYNLDKDPLELNDQFGKPQFTAQQNA